MSIRYPNPDWIRIQCVCGSELESDWAKLRDPDPNWSQSGSTTLIQNFTLVFAQLWRFRKGAQFQYRFTGLVWKSYLKKTGLFLRNEQNLSGKQKPFWKKEFFRGKVFILWKILVASWNFVDKAGKNLSFPKQILIKL
jgi:hypothetical protein